MWLILRDHTRFSRINSDACLCLWLYGSLILACWRLFHEFLANRLLVFRTMILINKIRISERVNTSNYPHFLRSYFAVVGPIQAEKKGGTYHWKILQNHKNVFLKQLQIFWLLFGYLVIELIWNSVYFSVFCYLYTQYFAHDNKIFHINSNKQNISYV